jgi:hypothetical protein
MGKKEYDDGFDQCKTIISRSRPVQEVGLYEVLKSVDYEEKDGEICFSQTGK